MPKLSSAPALGHLIHSNASVTASYCGRRGGLYRAMEFCSLLPLTDASVHPACTRMHHITPADGWTHKQTRTQLSLLVEQCTCLSTLVVP